VTARTRSNEFGEADLLTFAQKLLTVLDQGRTTATYKYAVLLGLMDLCLEKTSAQGTAPAMVTTVELAAKVIELYWSHASPYPDRETVLRQNSKGQAEILSAITTFRGNPRVAEAASCRQARLVDPAGYARLLATVEFKLAEMPLPKLQRVGDQIDEFLYRVAFQSAEAAVTKPSHLRAATFDNRIVFVGNAAEHLVALAPLLRPFIQREWATLVARFNGFPESALEAFLFGTERTATASLKAGLRECQDNRCFYCDGRITEPEVDHFVPWARIADNGLDNLVLVDRGCNSAKRAHLAATQHVERWSARFAAGSVLDRDLTDIAARAGWERDTARTLGVARGIYLHLPPESRLWLRAEHFEVVERGRMERALGAGALPV
jgi:hypothetical protein